MEFCLYSHHNRMLTIFFALQSPEKQKGSQIYKVSHHLLPSSDQTFKSQVIFLFCSEFVCPLPRQTHPWQSAAEQSISNPEWRHEQWCVALGLAWCPNFCNSDVMLMVTCCSSRSGKGFWNIAFPGLAGGGGVRGLVTHLGNRIMDFVHFLQADWYGRVQ